VGYANVTDSDPRLEVLKPAYHVQIRSKAKEILLEDELARQRKVSPVPSSSVTDEARKQKVSFANEGAEKARIDEAAAKRKREAEDKVKWEGES
jgi:DnaJ family protein C protein 8